MKRFLYFILALFVVFSCSENNDDTSDDNTNNNNNNNNTDVGFSEECSPASLPDGLELLIDGDSPSEIDTSVLNDYLVCLQNCAQTDPNDPECMMNCAGIAGLVPAGGAFSLTLYLTNTTGASITYKVEPGDWFEPGIGGYQPMLSPISITEIVEPGETKIVEIPVYCLNSQLSAPDSESEYSMCEMISSNGCLADIVNILKTKDLSSAGFTETTQIQEIIWACTEGKEVDLDYLNSLPDK